MLAAAVLAITFLPGSYADVPPDQTDGAVATVWPADAPPPRTVPRMEVLFEERAYLPVSTWTPQASPVVRRQALALALVMTALLVAALLVPKRRLLVVTLAATFGTAGVVLWAATRQPVHTMTGTVWLDDGRADLWTWYQSSTATTLHLPADRQTFLVPYDRRHLASLAPVLHVDAAGQVQTLTLTLPPGVTAAVVRVGTGQPTPGDGLSPLRTMARKLYLRPGVEIVAEGEGGVVIRARPPR